MAGMMGYGMGSGMGLGWLFSLLILAAFLLIVWWLLRGTSKESAKDILDKRLARGEITDREYRRLRKELGGGNGA